MCKYLCVHWCDAMYVQVCICTFERLYKRQYVRMSFLAFLRVHLNVHVCASIFTNPYAGVGYNTRSIFKLSWAGLNSVMLRCDTRSIFKLSLAGLNSELLRCDTRSIFKLSLAGLNSELLRCDTRSIFKAGFYRFEFRLFLLLHIELWLVASPWLKNLVCPTIYP